jgi:hypothetical protein
VSGGLHRFDEGGLPTVAVSGLANEYRRCRPPLLSLDRPR